MKIGNKPKERGTVQLNKWYFFIEILKCPPVMFGVFKPYITIGLVKFIKTSDYEFNGGKDIYKGGWKSWSSPIGIEFRINRYK
jgi:hypothetical protein